MDREWPARGRAAGFEHHRAVDIRCRTNPRRGRSREKRQGTGRAEPARAGNLQPGRVAHSQDGVPEWHLAFGRDGNPAIREFLQPGPVQHHLTLRLPGEAGENIVEALVFRVERHERGGERLLVLDSVLDLAKEFAGAADDLGVARSALAVRSSASAGPPMASSRLLAASRSAKSSLPSLFDESADIGRALPCWLGNRQRGGCENGDRGQAAHQRFPGSGTRFSVPQTTRPGQAPGREVTVPPVGS